MKSWFEIVAAVVVVVELAVDAAETMMMCSSCLRWIGLRRMTSLRRSSGGDGCVVSCICVELMLSFELNNRENSLN